VSLDDLMRVLWTRHGRVGVGVAEGGVEELASELAGTDLSDFFAGYVYGTTELPLAEWFDGIGVGFRLRGASKPDDLGGFIEKVEPVSPRKVLGARFQAAGELVQITHVFRGGAAHRAGLSAGDRLVAVDGLQARPDRLPEQIAALPDDRPALVHALRRDELMTFSLVPLPAPDDTCDLWLAADIATTEPRGQRRGQWLAPLGRAPGERG
jgi:predicted metalloprotease with PDZ domain